MTDIQITPKWKDVKPEGFYVYIHRRATDGTPFYVGKGKGRRAWAVSRGGNNHWKHTALKHGVIVDIVRDGMSHECALTLECIVIGIIGLNGLTNIKYGGGGRYEYLPSPEENISKSMRISNPVFSDKGELFHNCGDAARYMRKNGYTKATNSCIWRAASLEGRSAYGRNWSFKGIPSKPKTREPVNRCPILCVDLNIEFKSIKDAADWISSTKSINSTRGNIISAASGKTKTAYGYTWSYLT